jgi:hypothetical protein
VSRVFVHGQGAVSPAGWGLPALQAGLENGRPLPVEEMPRPGWKKPLPVRFVPPPSPRPAFLAHPRLRRASPVAQYSVGAALEALGGDASLVSSGALQFGIVECTMTGGISYSRRFYEEVIQDPATASPMVFSETVFNASASHLAAYLGAPAINYTMVGDAGTFLQGLALAAQWLEDGQAEACVVIGAEESDWTTADALRLFQRHDIHSAGAGAVYLKTERPSGAPVELVAVTDSFPVTRSLGQDEAARKMRAQLPAGRPNELLCSSEGANAAWKDWTGSLLTPKTVLGQAFVASAGWQCAAACDLIQRGRYAGVNVSVTGGGQQAIGARFVNPHFPSPPESPRPA